MSAIGKAVPALWLLSYTIFAQDPQLTVTSPSGRIEFALMEEIPGDAVPHRLGFQVRYDARMLVNPSPLGIRVNSQEPVLGEGLQRIGSRKTSIDERYAVPALDGRGRNHYNGLVAEFAETSGLRRSLTIEVRVFEDGVAFRYGFPKTSLDTSFFIEEEETEFRFATDGSISQAPSRPGGPEVPETVPLSLVPSSTEFRMPVKLNSTGTPPMMLTETTSSWAFLRHIGNGPNLIFRIPSRCGPCSDGPPIDPRLKVELKPPARSPWRVLVLDSAPVKQTETILNSLGRASLVEK